MSKVLITGASGFIGKALLTKLMTDSDYNLVIAVRKLDSTINQVEQLVIPDLIQPIDWQNALTNVTTVIHLAARAHVLKETASDPLAAFRLVNVTATIELAKQALAAGVKRFIFISSIGVNGNSNTRAFTEQDTPHPVTNYARSKLEAEQALKSLTNNTTMELVIIRPPLVYGKGVQANFYSLIKWVERDIPLPLGRVRNSRSLVALDNLVDFITICIKHPQAANQIFLVADKEQVSTPELLMLVAKIMGKKSKLLPIPVILLKFMALILGKKNMAIQLCDSLTVSTQKAQQLLTWQPPVSLYKILNDTVSYYLEHK